jgi:hypothetical protein
LFHLKVYELLDVLIIVGRDFYVKEYFARVFEADFLITTGDFSWHRQKVQLFAGLEPYSWK